jgi:carbon storage regulator CsrA
MVVQIQKDKVRLGIDAPNDVLIYREEIAEDFVKKHENKKLLK